MRRGALELSVNALVVFIVSVIVLGFGVVLVGKFFALGTQIVKAPDNCGPQLQQAISQGDRFAVCPASIPATDFSPHKTYQIEYAYYNLADSTNENYAVGFLEPGAASPSFEAQPSSLDGVAKGQTRQGKLLIKPTSTTSGTAYTLKVFICPLTSQADATAGCAGPYGSATDPSISRVLTINS